ncbi:MAG TPA: PQQ-binding-like beta-propeller repeat protein [Thermoanaerobaculia bacterium]
MQKKIFRAAGALALLASLFAPGVLTAQALQDGVVVDPAGGAAYVMSPGGGIEARDVATGNVLWQSDAAAKPLLAMDGSLVAQAAPNAAGDLVVVTLDARKGSARDRTEIKLPPGQRSQLTDGPSRSFRAQAFPAGDGGVIVSWTAEQGRALQGIEPPELQIPQVDAKDARSEERRAEILAAAHERWRGAFRLDVASGKTAPLPFAEAAAKAPVLSARIGGGGGGDKAAGGVLGSLTSLDGRHVLTAERSSGDSWNQYRWTVTDAATGAVVGAVDAPVSMAPFVVSGTRILYVAEPGMRKEGNQFVQKPPRLRALDLQTGAEMWEAPTVDPTYRGPLPS